MILLDPSNGESSNSFLWVYIYVETLQNGCHVQNLLTLTGIESIKDFAEVASAVAIELLPKFIFDQSENRTSQCHNGIKWKPVFHRNDTRVTFGGGRGKIEENLKHLLLFWNGITAKRVQLHHS